MDYSNILINFSFAFLAGVSSLFHPCAFALLPGYTAYLIGSKSLTQGIKSGLTFTLGLITILAILGALLSTVGGFLIDIIPWLQIVVAFAIIFLGLVQILNLNLPSLSPRIRVKKGLMGLFIFGLGFGLVISGCSAPVFFSVILYSFLSGIQNGVLALASYGLGMGTITMVVSVITLRTKKSMMNRLIQYSTMINWTIGLILIIVGLYILYNSLLLI
ncbi:MAG: cytochrome c biogenesis CcdA family protein [Candidatus Bathyarchaeota archaeon]|nr:cytochrome c biogenesis CcdA family protein [Candidatus Bathyarchaeota archaeon]